ncbi:uncharacterized protein [Diabrotica undecimpunctata]|uniref:uncharacterized protein n=1 Tax=Diabrotica undecimpunctata TaxID=50387 RepID=UPI003B63E752
MDRILSQTNQSRGARMVKSVLQPKSHCKNIETESPVDQKLHTEPIQCSVNIKQDIINADENLHETTSNLPVSPLELSVSNDTSIIFTMNSFPVVKSSLNFLVQEDGSLQLEMNTPGLVGDKSCTSDSSKPILENINTDLNERTNTDANLATIHHDPTNASSSIVISA